MARWFRSHASKLNNPKVQRLSDAQYRAWDSLLCVACEFGGKLPSLSDTSFLLRKPEAATEKLIDVLIERGFFVKTERGVEPHQWNEWQYKSDVSTERVKRFREQQRNVSSNVSETPSESEADTETDSVAKATGADAPDPVKLVFDAGVRILTATGLKEPQARSLIGKWRKDNGDDAVLAAIGSCQRSNVSEPVSWITATFKAETREARDARRDREVQEAIQRSKLQ